MSTLLNFKQGIKDPSGELSSWFLDRKDCCQWTGVRCDKTTGRVTELSLPCHTTSPAYSDKDDKSHCLTGELNLSSLLNLEFLEYLDLSNNDFKTIQYDSSMHNQITPCNDLSRVTHLHQCGNSSNLQYLDLSNNHDLLIYNLHWFSHVSFLKYLDLSGIDIHREIDWLRSMTMLSSLSELYLESCQLHDLYPSLQYANFTSLKVLDLADNNFASELPNWLFNLSCDISHIILAKNHIHGQLPKALLNLRSIKSLSLAENNMDGPIPEWFGQFEQLQEIVLSYNSFSGPIPTSLGNLSSLTVLNLNSNNLRGNLPESLGNLSNLMVFFVAKNFLMGNISQRNFQSLVNLKYLGLSSPGLIFDFDPEWVPPFQIQVIRFQYVAPKLPSWLYTQSSLKVLTISYSRVSFEPLHKFWKLAAQLEFLSLTNNSVNADMSNVLLNSKVIWLDGNNLRGGVPQVSPNVTVLHLYNNNLSGSISPLLCQKIKPKRNLEDLDISNNRLFGVIPNCWTDWEMLLHVSLANNNLAGKIPNSMGSLSSLISLDLSNNKLSGGVPISLQNCKNLWILNLAGNNFSGALPKWKEHNAKALIFRSNQFSGNVPAEVCQLHSLKILDFANNRLSGSIPNCFHNMTSMISDYASIDAFFIQIEVLNETIKFLLEFMLLIKGMELPYSKSLYAIDLSSNRLSGTVPSELFMLIRLQSLNLSHNQLEGMMPQEIANLNQLESVDLSSNRFSGKIPQSMSGMSFLEVLNLSFNNFMGEIPSGTQLQSFTNLSYMGNPQLCGPPLTKSCTQGVKPNNTDPVMKDENDDEESEVHSMFYMGLGIGFAAGLWGVLGVIFFNKRCRHAYFRFISKLYDNLLLKMDHVYWKLRNCYNGN